jgi:SIT4-associating protein SAP185/190
MMVERELRDPFADDEEDEDASGSGSGSDGEGAQGGRGSGGSGWHRGSWWRGVVRSARRGGGTKEENRTTERFGDGRDDDSEDSEGDADEVMDDEEFGDFAMPEVSAAPGEGASAPPAGSGRAEGATDTSSGVTGIDPAREKVLVKPLPLHPAANKTSASPFGSLWPFSTQGFSMGGKEKEKDAPSSSKELTSTKNEPEITEEPLELEAGEGVLSEDGKKIDRAVEAKRRTSIEDPDDDDVDVGEEIIVGRGGLS